MYAAYGIMLALRVKERTGRGQAIDVSMLEGQLSLLGTMIGGYLADGEIPRPMGTAYKALLPYQTFRTKTRDLALAVGSEKLWKVFCPVIGCPELADDPRYRTNADRGKNRDTLIPRLQDIFLTKSYEQWEAILVPAGARLWFDDAATTSTGAIRQFNSPPLTPGTRASYEVRARWTENGHEVTQTQRVEVTAGANVRVNFPVAPETAGRASATK